MMAVVRCNSGGFDASRTAANDGNLLTYRRFLYQLFKACFQTGGGVDGALEVMAVNGGVVAAHALDAGGNVLGFSGHALVNQFGISNQASGHGHKICLAVLNDALSGFQRVDGAKGYDGYMDFTGFLEGLCHIDVGHGGPEAAGMNPGHPLGVVHTGGNLENVQMILDQLANADALVQVNAALFKLGAGNPDLDEQLIANTGTNGVENLNEIPAAVLRGATVFIGPLVGQRGEKLRQGNRSGSKWRRSRSLPGRQQPVPIPP